MAVTAATAPMTALTIGSAPPGRVQPEAQADASGERQARAGD